jgi:hypothetical protein
MQPQIPTDFHRYQTNSKDDALILQPGRAEVQQQGGSEARSPQVVDRLSEISSPQPGA